MLKKRDFVSEYISWTAAAFVPVNSWNNYIYNNIHNHETFKGPKYPALSH